MNKLMVLIAGSLILIFLIISQDAAQTVTATIPVGDAPNFAGVNPNTNRIYISNSGDDGVSVIWDALVPTIEGCDGSGVTKNKFNIGDYVYVVGSGYANSQSYNLKIVIDAEWVDGMTIPSAIVETTVSSDSSGDIMPTLAWSGAALENTI